MNKGTMKYLTVEDIDDLEEEAVITSPRSIEACLQEGIKPKDLLFIPESEFSLPNVPDEIRHIHYEFFEAKRKDILYKVRKTRKNLIADGEGITRSSTAAVFYLPPKQSKEIFQAKVVKKRMIGKMIERENILEQVAREREIENIEKLEKDFNSSVSLAENAKKRFFRMKNDEKIRELKVEKQAEANEQYRRRLDQKRLEKIHQIIENAQEKWQAIENKKEKNELKMKDHYRKMQQRLDKISSLRKNKLLETDARKKEILENIISQKLAKQKEMEEKWNEKMKVKETLKSKLKEEITNKQIEYYTVKQSIDKKYEEFVQEKNKPRVFKINPEKINKTILIVEKDLRDKKHRIDSKSRKSQAFITNSHLKIQQNIEYKKNLNVLKKLKQDWNIERIKNKEQYMETLNFNKYHAKLEKINDIELQKSLELQEAIKSSVKFEKMNQNLNEAIQKMSITKHWDKEALFNIITDEDLPSKNKFSWKT